MQGIELFSKELEELGVGPVEVSGNRLCFDYAVESGRFRGKQIRLGFEVPPNWVDTPPSGPHLSPRLLPLNQGGATHQVRSHESKFGESFSGDWEYWSRPYPKNQWGKDGYTVRAYMAHIRNLFETV